VKRSIRSSIRPLLLAIRITSTICSLKTIVRGIGTTTRTRTTMARIIRTRTGIIPTTGIITGTGKKV
jgi:hypothetical protein